ncbi:MAG TPA: hypothetical protein VG125_18200 [Pirellulales bacterium]|jgi:hypothetical protein|nr:hypothetical protein [Pirellulales bacterium]
MAQQQPKWFMAICGGLVLWGAILVAASWRTQQRASDLPRMSCEELLRKGRAAPQFVTLTDVRLCQNGFAFRRDMDAATETYVPAFSTTLKDEPPAADLRLLLEVLEERESDRLLACPAVGELTVELWTDARTLDPWIEKTLAPCYPGIQLANCRVLSVGLHEPSAVRAQYELQDGMVMILAAAVCQLGWWIWVRGMRSLNRVPAAIG